MFLKKRIKIKGMRIFKKFNVSLIKYKLLIIILLLFSKAIFASKTPPNELRGIWISDPTKCEWEKAIKDFKKIGINNIFINFASAGVTFYESKILPNNLPKEPLEKLIELAHKEGMFVHAKILVFFMYFAPKKQNDLMIERGRVLLSSKGKIQLQSKTPWLDPSQIENRIQMQSVIKEILENFNVDGIQLDYIRFYEEHGIHESILKIRTAVLTNFVSETGFLIKNINPKIRYSACIFYDLERAKNEMAQDWETWSNNSIFNFYVPMNYTLSNKNLMKWIYSQELSMKKGTTFYSGLGAYMDKMSSDKLFEQINIIRRAKVPGFVLFSYTPEISKNILIPLGKKLKSN